jgi:SAM-dependent methyltransferase
MDLSPAVRAYYEYGGEVDRLSVGNGRLELLRTQDVLRRVLPPPPARVLDVGGATGVHARWLAADGYAVRVVDPVPLHVSHAASIPGVEAVEGDARRLDEPAGAYDAVMLLGPLYHLPERVERVAALREAARVAVPGGVVAAATISRFAGLYDTLARGAYADPGVRRITDAGVATGIHRPFDAGLFTDAYFHHPDEVPAEFAAAGMTGAERYAVEGGAWLLARLDEWLAAPDVLLHALRSVEQEDALFGISSHLLTVARTRRPPAGQRGESPGPA